MQVVALIPGIVAAFVALRRGAAAAFLDVYLPVLLLAPDYFRWIAPGLPDPTMNEAAIVPIAAVFLLRERTSWRTSGTDALVFGFAFLLAVTEFSAKNYAEAQNLMFDALCTIVFPYVLAKGLIEPRGLTIRFARRFATLVAAAGLISLYEFRFGVNPFRVWLGRFFPGQGAWVTTFRHGFARVAGPYGHAILAGMVFLAAHRIARWLEWIGTDRHKLRGLPVTRARALSLALVLGLGTCLARGPQLGALVGATLLVVARSRHRRSLALGLVAFGCVAAGPAYLAGKAYVAGGREAAKSISQETAAYRAELFEKYTDIALERPILGWGRGAWPKVPGLESTDNHYLLLALNHGVVALLFFVGMIAGTGVRLVRYASRRRRDDPHALLAFSLAGILAGYFVSLATVYHGMQTIQVFFLILGWADGLLVTRVATALSPRTLRPALPVRPAHGFRRVLA